VESQLKLIPKSWLSWDFTAMDASDAIADIDMSAWREKGAVTIQGTSYALYREGLMSGDFVLESAGSVLARARKPSAFRRCFVVEHTGREYTLRAETAFRRRFILLDNSTEVGSISPEGSFSRRVTVDLPSDMLLPVRIFIVWLAVVLWKRESDAASAGASS
jgi:hypothetical protein